MFREGLEAFLIVGVTLSYLRKVARTDLVRVVHLAVALAVVASIGAGWLFSQADNRALWEGILALVAALIIIPLTVQMLQAGRHMQARIQTGLEDRLHRRGAALAVFLFVLFMITREGMEMALLLSTLLFSVGEIRLALGASFGIGAAAVLASTYSRYGHRIHLGRLLQMTGVFLVVFSLQLLIVGFHELAEANVLPYAAVLHDVTEAYGPTGKYGQWFSYLLILIPLAWLSIASVWKSISPLFESHGNHAVRRS